MLLSQSGQSDRVVILGVGTSIPSAGGICTPQVVRAPLGATLPTKQTLQTLETLSRGHSQH
jgi:hypothetical protein